MTDIRTMAAGPEMDLRLAKAIGLPVCHVSDDAFPTRDPWVAVHLDGSAWLRSREHYPVRWHPSADTGQAVDYGGAWLKSRKYDWRLEYQADPDDEFYLIAMPDDETENVFVVATAAALAFCRGVILVAEAMKEAKS